MCFTGECLCFCPPFCLSRTYRDCRSTNMEACVFHIWNNRGKRKTTFCVSESFSASFDHVYPHSPFFACIILSPVQPRLTTFIHARHCLLTSDPTLSPIQPHLTTGLSTFAIVYVWSYNESYRSISNLVCWITFVVRLRYLTMNPAKPGLITFNIHVHHCSST